MGKRMEIINSVERERRYLESKLEQMISSIGPIPIGNPEIMPFGWRKAAKGRTVWRITEEIISQNLELKARELGFQRVVPADSEVGVWDFKFVFNNGAESFVNIKSSVLDGRRNKDDISKAKGLLDFYSLSPQANLYIATFVIRFCDNMTIEIMDCVVFPITWIPDVYVNPSNNGNLQSADYKNISRAILRTNEEFLELLHEECIVASAKKRKKLD